MSLALHFDFEKKSYSVTNSRGFLSLHPESLRGNEKSRLNHMVHSLTCYLDRYEPEHMLLSDNNSLKLQAFTKDLSAYLKKKKNQKLLTSVKEVAKKLEVLRVRSCLAVKIDTDLSRIGVLLEQDLSEEAAVLLISTLQNCLLNKSQAEPYITLKRVLKRYEQIASAVFEENEMSRLEILHIAHFIEVSIHKVENVNKRYFPKHETRLARSLQLKAKTKEVYLLADYQNSLFKNEGSYKRVANAVKLPFQEFSKNPILVAQLVTKTDESSSDEAKKKEIENTKREVSFSKRLRSAPRGIAKFYTACDFTETIEEKKKKRIIPKMSIVVEKSDGDLQKIFEKDEDLNEEEILNIAEDLISGLHYMHEQNLVHGDVKLENCLIFRDRQGFVENAKLTDFGFTFEFDPKGYKEAETTLMYKLGLYGTPEYTAPELIGSLEFKNNFHLTEVWALGTLFWSLYFQKKGSWQNLLNKHDKENYDNEKLVFKDQDKLNEMKQEYRKLIREELEPALKKLPPSGKATPMQNFERLIYRMLDFNPRTRITMKEAVKEIEKIRESQT